MPVLVFDSSDKFHGPWAKQWLNADPLNRKILGMKAGLGHKGIRDIIVQGAKLAGQTAFNELILAVGHGGSISSTEGTIDLAPNRAMTLYAGTIGAKDSKNVECFYNPDYDVVRTNGGILVPKSQKMLDEDAVRQKDKVSAPSAQFRLDRWSLYNSIGEAIRTGNVNQVVLLTCRVGNAVDFIKKIAFDWKVKIKAYKRRVIFQGATATSKARVFLEGDKDGSGSNTALGETAIPQIDFVTVGPPLTPQPVKNTPAPKPPKRASLSTWSESIGFYVHPNAPAGRIGAPPPGLAGTENDENYLPHPYSPAARTVNPTRLWRG